MDPAQKHAIPYGAWPRGLSRAQAAAYAGVGETKFMAEVEDGLWPKPETRGGRSIWDRRRMDEAWDRRGGTEGEPDPLMEALDDRKA